MIPARDTVAGEALFRFSGSKKAFICGVIRILSPFARVRTYEQRHVVVVVVVVVVVFANCQKYNAQCSGV